MFMLESGEGPGTRVQQKARHSHSLTTAGGGGLGLDRGPETAHPILD